jgi:beta-glucosidase
MMIAFCHKTLTQPVRRRTMVGLVPLVTLLLLVVLTVPRPATGADPQVAGTTTRDATEPTAIDPALVSAKFRDARLPIEARIDDLLPRLTPVEKASLLHGIDDMRMGGIPRIGLSAFGTTDGPQGVRGPAATEFPSGIAMAASWDPQLVEHATTAMAEETLAAGSRMQLGPGVNIMRTPLGGRSFEYMGEDPVLAGEVAAGYVRGLQGRGVSACVKHFTGNEQERWRTTANVVMPERALREIYAKPFEICVRDGHPWAIMAAYNKLDGDYCCQSHHLLSDLLRADWHWDGQVVSDWGAWHDTTRAVNAGCDIEMGGFNKPSRDRAVAAMVEGGTIHRDAFDAAVRATLRLMFRVGAFDPAAPVGRINTPDHQATASDLAASAVVLLKNDGGALPLDPAKVRRVAVIGPAADWRFTGRTLQVSGGSGAVFPPYEVTALQGLRARLGPGVEVTYAAGYTYGWDRAHAVATPLDLPAAVAAARGADAAIVCVGTNHTYDRESLGWGDVPGADKPDLNLIGPATELVRAVAAANPRTVVVLTTGGPANVEDWIDAVPAVVEAWYPGMEGGNAITSVLVGDVNPSGRLPCTFGRKLDDWLCHTMGPTVFPGTGNKGTERYDDGIWVGYRHFDHAGIDPRFPFGFGLSYSTFTLGGLAVDTLPEGSYAARVAVPNSGPRDGSDVVELYVEPPPGPVERPVRELEGFAKVAVPAGATRVVAIPFTRASLAYWSDADHGWAVPPGRYTVRAGHSSRDLMAGVPLDVR